MCIRDRMRRGISVSCIEGMNRIGGRCYTDVSTFGVPADHGAHWLHGHKQNEIALFGFIPLPIALITSGTFIIINGSKDPGSPQ